MNFYNRRPRPFCLASLALSVATLLPAQTITVRLLNARSGKPVPNRNVTFHWSPGAASSIVHVDGKGIGHVNLPPGASQFILVEGPLLGRESGHAALADCNADSSTLIAVTEVLAHGVTPRDICQNRTVPPQPGEIVFWGQPQSGWFSDLH